MAKIGVIGAGMVGSVIAQDRSGQTVFESGALNPDGSINRLFVQLSKLHGVEFIDWKTRQIAGKITLPSAPADARPLRSPPGCRPGS